MTALVAAETVLIALLVVLVAGLLRSHAEILRRLHEIDSRASDQDPSEGTSGAELLPGEGMAPVRADDASAPAIDGASLAGDTVRVGFAPGAETLLAFLTSGCSVCRDLWAQLDSATRGPLAGVRVVVVAKDRKLESVSKLRKLAPDGVSVVLSSEAWEDFSVPASPYFVHVGVNAEIAGEGVSSSWDGVISLLADARADLDEHGVDGAGRMRRVEDELERAGVGPDHPSLYADATRDAA
ncbi:MAG: hypothetical protein ACR2OD_12140 [Gaiellaceae bacterium]